MLIFDDLNTYAAVRGDDSYQLMMKTSNEAVNGLHQLAIKENIDSLV